MITVDEYIQTRNHGELDFTSVLMTKLNKILIYGFEKLMLATRHSDFRFRLHMTRDLFIIIYAHCITLVEASRAKSPAQQRGRAWGIFHRLRCTSILEMWQDLLLKLNIEYSNLLLLQTVTLEVFKAMLKECFPFKPPQYTHFDAKIAEDEKNMMICACGYVPLALIDIMIKELVASMHHLFSVCYIA